MYSRILSPRAERYGHGYDTLGLADDGRAFRAWFNAMAHSSVLSPDIRPRWSQDDPGAT